MASVQSVERALLLLTEIGREAGGLVDLATRTDLPTSTTARLLNTLEQAGAVVRSDSTYQIGPAIQSMVRSPDVSIGLEAITHPHLIELSELLDEAACLAIVSGDETVTVDQVDAPKPIQAENWTGTRVPMHAGGAGAVVMATWPDSEVDRYLAGDLATFSPSTVTDPQRLRIRVRQARVRRVLWSHGEFVDGLSSCSAAVVDRSGRAVAALYTYGPSFRFPAQGEADRIASAVLDHADQISAQLGWTRQANEAT